MTAGDDITRTGPRGYELQYDVTAWLALEAPPGSRLHVETVDGEDAELRVHGHVHVERVDLQVKGAAGEVDIDALVEVLTHFPKRDRSACLLERLSKDPGRLLLLVAAGRATDDTVALCAVGPVLEPHPPGRSAKKTSAALRKALTLLPEPSAKKKLLHARWSSIKRFVASLDDAGLGALLLRVSLVENTTRPVIDRLLVESLIREGLARSEAEHSLPALGDLVVRVARDARDDLLPRLRRFVEERRANRAGPWSPGVEPPLRAALRDRLAREHVVLLTGHSQSGKTHTAGLLCQELQDAGWDYMAADTVDDAARYLRRADAADAVMLLEDPFGHESLRPDARNAWSMLGRLVGVARQNRRLVVTSARARVQELAAKAPPWATGGRPWIDVTTDDRVFLRHVWQHLAASLRPEHRSAVDERIATGAANELWQPGHLQRLVAPLSGLPDGQAVDFDEADRYARQEAEAIAQAFIERGDATVRVVEALGLTATTIDEVFADELTFVLEGDEARPGAASEAGSPGLTLGGRQRNEIVWPSYPARTLSLAHSAALADLERRAIVIVRGAARVFAHPDYVLAARLLLERPTAARAPEVRGRLERALCCLRPTTARVATRVFRALAVREGTEVEILEAGRVALRSLFPAVRDRVAETLLQLLAYRDDGDLLTHALSHESWDIAVRWREGEAWYSPESVVRPDIDQIYAGKRVAERARVALDELARGGRLAPESVRDVLLAAAARRVDLTDEVASQFLSYDEALLRAWTADTLLTRNLTISTERLEELLRDPSPRVWAATVQGLLASWHAQGTEVRAAALRLLGTMPLDPLRAHLAARMLLRLPDDVAHEKGELATETWPFWAALLTRILSELPRARFELERLSYLLEKAHVDADTKISLIDRWAQALLERNFSHLTSTDALIVAHSLLEATASESAKREDRLARWLTTTDTAFVAITIQDMVEAWGELRPDERSALLEILHADRADREWLRAVSLTGRTRPADVVTSAGISMATPRDAVDTMPAPMLECCLSVAIGYPEIFAALNLSHRDVPFWDEVVREILTRPGHPARSIAIRRLLARRKPDDAATWRDRCAQADAAESRMLFALLLEASVDHPGRDLRPFWDLWFAGPTADATSATPALVAAAPKIDRFHELRETLGHQVWLTLIEAHPSDARVVSEFIAFQKERKTRDEFIAEATDAFRCKAPPVLPSVHGYVRDVARDSKKDAAEALLVTIEELVKAQRDEAARNEPEPTPPRGWLRSDNLDG